MEQHALDQFPQQRRGAAPLAGRSAAGRAVRGDGPVGFGRVAAAGGGRRTEQPAQLVLGQAGQRGQPVPDQRRQHRRADPAQERPGRRHQRRAALVAHRRMPCGELRQQELGQRRRPLDLALERVLAAPADEIVRILALGQEQERELLAVGDHRQRVLERAPGRLAPGVVAVEAEHDVVGESQQLLHVHRGGGGPERGHRVVDAVLGERDDVHVALDDDDAAGIADRVTREEEAVELAALREQRRLRRVQVLGLALPDHPAAEADDLPAGVVDRKHDPVAKPVVTLAAVAGDDEADGFQHPVVVLGEHRGERLPPLGRVADAEAGGDGAGEPAVLEVGDRSRAVLERRAVELGGGEHQLRVVLRLDSARGLALALDARHREPGVAGELLDGLGERLAAVLHQEADRGAVRAAAEAVVELLGLAHRERGCLLAVEGAAGDVVGPGLLERHVPVDHVDDVDAGEQGLDEVGRNHGVRDASSADAAWRCHPAAPGTGGRGATGTRGLP